MNYRIEKAPIIIFFTHMLIFITAIVLIITNNLFFEFQTSQDRYNLILLIYILASLSFLLVCFYTTIDTTLQSRKNYSKGVNKIWLKIIIFSNLLLGLFASYQFAVLQSINKLI